MLNTAISVIGILLTIFFIVGIHELGHFLTARMLGIKVLRFSIGFGKALYRWHDKKGTEYVLAAIPLGGYVKMLDETEETVAPEEAHLAFNRQPLIKKFAVVAAGPFANLVFAFAIYWVLFVVGFTSITPLIGAVTPNSIAAQAGLKPAEKIVRVENHQTTSWMSVAIQLLSYIGDKGPLSITTQKANQPERKYSLDITHWRMNDLQPDPISSLGLIPYSPEVPAVIGKILPGSPAEKFMLLPGDLIIAINTKPVKDWLAFTTMVDAHPDETLSFTVKRQGQIKTIAVTVEGKRDLKLNKHGFLGISPQFEWPKNLLHDNRYGPIDALQHAWQSTYDFTYLNLLVFGKLLTGNFHR